MPAPKKPTATDAPDPENVVEEPQAAPDEPVITAQDFTRDASHAVGVAGMLADSPSLADEKLTLSEWEQKYTQYMTSERP